MLTCAQGGCVVHRCQNKNPRERLTSGCEWCHALEAHAEDFEGFEKKSVELKARDQTRRVDFQGSQRRDEFAHSRRRMRWGGGRWKRQNRKNVYFSPYVEEPLNSKVIKSFVPELRSRKCFSCFEIPMFYVYIYIYIYMNVLRTGMNISISHIRIMGMVHKCIVQDWA